MKSTTALIGLAAAILPSLAAAWAPLSMLQAAPAQVQKRTLDPATSNTKGKCPSTLNCSASKTSNAIQAAECAYNTRTSTTETFAVFKTNHQYDSSHGAPYGTCSAYTCTAPTSAQMTDVDEDCWTFFWSGGGESSGVGTTCIKDPNSGECGCENSDGTFVVGSSSCT